MTSWPDRRILDLFRISLPIIQAPMAGASTPEMAIAVSEAGGLGSLPCAMYSAAQARAALDKIRAATSKPINLNFFCHEVKPLTSAAEQAWREALAPFYREYGLDPETPAPASGRAPFDREFLSIVESYRPEIVSFHFGLPEAELLEGVRATGARIIASATTVAEARWLEARGCDAIIAMGSEAGGHRGMFLTEDVACQVGLFALLPQIVDAVSVPVIAAGGIGDARGIVAAFALGAAAVQLGTAYLLCPEATITEFHREALSTASDDSTAITNVFTGRPARGIMNRLMREIGPLSDAAPPFPYAGGALQPLRAKAAADFTNQWSGQASVFAREAGAAEITRRLAEEALRHLASFGTPVTSDPFDLERFLAAQDPVYHRVVTELRSGRKTSHWMWFVFPQIDGLGSSAMAKRYAIRSRDEAAAYLVHPILGPRLVECTKLVLDAGKPSVSDIFGWPDDLKFHSSMTLFANTALDEPCFARALQRFFAGAADPATLDRLSRA